MTNKPPPKYTLCPDYIKILEELKYYHQETLGLTDYLGTSNSDKTNPKQNNVEIALLITLHQKIDKTAEKVKTLEIDKFEKI